MIARLPVTARVGLALIAIAIAGFGGWNWWMATRTWVPLDLPISLSRGHIRTPEFKINVESTYYIHVPVEPEFDFEGGPCIPGVRCPSALETSWSISQGGRVIARGKNNPRGRALGCFNAGKGRYVLELDVWQDGTRLNAGAPHLAIFEIGGAYENASFRGTLVCLLSVILSAVGICLIIRAAIVRRQETLDALARASALTQPGPLAILTGVGADLPVVAGTGSFREVPFAAAARVSSEIDRRYHPRKPHTSIRRPLSGLSTIGLILALTYLPVFISIGVLQSWQWVTPMGLRVHLLHPPAASQGAAGLQPLLVQLKPYSFGVRPTLYVDSQPVSWEEFDKRMRKEINRRPPDWPVYLDGDPDMEFGYVVNVIDKLRGLRAEVVLLTGTTVPSRAQPGAGTTSKQAGPPQPGKR